MTSRIDRRFLNLARLLVLLVVGAGALLAPAQAADVDWAQYRFEPAHSGVNPFETAITPSNVQRLAELWSVTLGPGGTGLGGGLVSPPSVVGGVIFQHSQWGYLYALDAATGAELWNAKTIGYGSSQPAVIDGVVYVGTIYGVRAYPTVCATPCDPLWVAEPDMTFNPSVTVKDGVVYAGAYDGRLVALDAATGDTRWSADVNVDFMDPVWGAATVAGDAVYVPADIGVIAYPTSCVGPHCSPLWSYTTEYSVERSPAVVDGVVYAVDDQGTLVALDAMTGALRWSASTSWMPQGPVVADGLVLVAAGDGTLAAFSTSCNKPRCRPVWKTPRVQYSPLALFEPTVAGGVVYVGAIDQYYTHGMILAMPLHCANPCLPTWRVDVEGAIESAPTVVNGTVYAGTLLGRLYAFGLPR